ncbi:MAG: putative baseplate assembly protein [Blastococcus sp.]
MTRPAPPVDPRGYADLVADTTRLAQLLSPWRPPDAGPDLGGALIAVFAGIAEQVLTRLNAVPERDFLAFLELLGVEPLPARAAGVPLTFSPPAGAAAAGLVPAGTPVTAPGADGPPVRFFTERDLVVSPAVLAAAVVQDPAADRRADVTAAATGTADEAADQVWPAFAGNSLVPHALHVAHDGFLTLPHPRTIGVTVTFADPAARDAFAGLPLEWGWWDGTAWQPVDATGSNAGDTGWAVTLGDVPASVPVQVAGRTARWLRARLQQAIDTVPGVDRALVQAVTVTADVTDAAPAPPAAAFSGAVPVDLAGDAYPFGEQPRFTDTFTIGSDVLGHAGAVVTLDVSISSGLPVAPAGSDGLALVWEVGGADGWVPVGRSVPVGDPQGAGFADGTSALTNSGTVTFPVPATGGPLVIGGVSTWWLRVRIAAGDYGRAATYQQAADPSMPPVLVPATYAPPAVSGLRVGWRFHGAEPSRATMTVDGEDAEDRTGTTGFPPFRADPGDRPVLYLGVDRPFPNRPVLLHVQVEPASDPGGAAPPPAPPVWEYATATGWADLGAVDETRGLSRSGPVGFVGPADLVPTTMFGRTLCWLRLRPAAPGPAVSPRLRRTLLNTVPASAAVPAADEVLGVSDATASLTFRTTRTPVLDGERVEVLTAGEWQAWDRTPDFASSGPLDHSYVLDRERGEVRFGDGRHGAVPPAGSTVRASYRSGGGSAGNRPAGAVTQLEVALAGVESVVNHEPAAGGADAEPLERVRVRGPVGLRHGGRAVAAEDYPDLAVATSPDVARALAVPVPINPLDVAWIAPVPIDPPVDPVPIDHMGGAGAGGSVLCSAPAADVATHRPERAGRVTVAVVPESSEARPVPSRQLLDEVGDALRPRSPAVLGGNGLTVAGPVWIELTARVTVAATDLTAAGALAGAVTAALDRFLHPLHGGPDGTGWPFGRAPHRSDLLALLSAVPGTDHVVALDLGESPSRGSLSTDELARALVWSGQHTVTVVPSGETP